MTPPFSFFFLLPLSFVSVRRIPSFSPGRRPSNVISFHDAIPSRLDLVFLSHHRNGSSSLPFLPSSRAPPLDVGSHLRLLRHRLPVWQPYYYVNGIRRSTVLPPPLSPLCPDSYSQIFFVAICSFFFPLRDFRDSHSLGKRAPFFRRSASRSYGSLWA